MCAIMGLHLGKKVHIVDKIFLESLLEKLYARCIERGRDSAGIAIKNEIVVPHSRRSAKDVTVIKTTGHPSELVGKIKVGESVIVNLRAEPTNEYIENKTHADVQPFEYGGVHLVHNGTVANDKELLKKLEVIDPPTSIDSYVLPALISKRGSDLRSAYDMIEGSVATAWFSENDDSTFLYRNYQPLCLFYLYDLRAYIFCSQKKAFEGAISDMDADFKSIHYHEIELPPYSMCTLCGDTHEISTVESRFDDRAIVIISGGLDSTTVASIAAEKHSFIVLAHFLYGCRAEEREWAAVQKIAEHLQKEYPDKTIKAEAFDMSYLKKLGGNSLTDHSIDVATGEAGAEFCHEWVPARNTVMIAQVAAYCDRWDVGNIYMGLNLEESGAYPDNTVEFYEKFNDVLAVGTTSRPRVHNPLDNLMKHEIVKLALDIKSPIHLSWSCYKGGDVHCGDCGPCYLRSKAFKMNGIEDMLEYENLPNGFWEGCNSVLPMVYGG